MREIKFRQWDDYNKSFHYWGHTGRGEFTNPLHPDRFPSEQFTGLLDKNGVEIYEGDIVNIKSAGNILSWNFAIDDPVNQLATVFFKDGAFVTDFHKISPLGIALSDKWAVTVVGNIHQNPGITGGRQ